MKYLIAWLLLAAFGWLLTVAGARTDRRTDEMD